MHSTHLPIKPPKYQLNKIVAPKAFHATPPLRLKSSHMRTRSLIESELNITGKLYEFKYRYERLVRIKAASVDEGGIFTNPVIKHSLEEKKILRLPRLPAKSDGIGLTYLYNSRKPY